MKSHKQKIKSKKEIAKISAQLKNQGKKIVTTNGSFDLIHAGHLVLFQKAKSKGDILMVGVNSDKSVKAYKGPTKPIIPEKYRAEMIAALQYVDYVTILGDKADISCDFVRLVKPDVHCNGANWGKDCIEASAVKEVGGKLCLVKIKSSLSTSNIIKKIKGLD